MKRDQTSHFVKFIYFVFILIGCSGNQNSESNSQEENLDSLILASGDLKFRNIHFCTEMLPPPPPNFIMDVQMDTSIFYREGKDNDTFVSTSYDLDEFQIASLKQYQWGPTQRDIRVTFLDGDLTTQRRVMETAKKWEQFCGVRFIFGDFPSADITISFLYEGSWSYIGTYSRRMRPSMNFGWLYSDTPQEEYDRVVLHEFGHALGFIHEHQNPNGNIKWNKEMVYNYYMRAPNSWDVQDVDRNIFQKYSKDHVNATQFDSNSIMIYAIPSELTEDGYSVTAKSELSDLDKSLVSTIYPKK